jgi:putative DNA primase/helicase
MPEIAVIPDEPVRRRLLVMDATPEAVGSILAGNLPARSICATSSRAG